MKLHLRRMQSIAFNQKRKQNTTQMTCYIKPQ